MCTSLNLIYHCTKGQLIKHFDSLNLSHDILQALEDLKYINPTVIQRKAIPIILKKLDILGVAQSGTGKTATFALPILEELSNKKEGTYTPRALVVTPTRELAVQISKNFNEYAKYLDIKVALITGGIAAKPQMNKLRNGVDIIVATPGRLLDLVTNHDIKISSVNTLVIDEADTMLDFGFMPDVEKICQRISSNNRQTMMFSATFSQNIKVLGKKFLKEPVVVEIKRERPTLDIIDQQVVRVDLDKKKELLSYLIGSKNWKKVLVFTNTKKQADELVVNLNLDGLSAEAIHGDITQPARQRALTNLQSGKTRVVVATDIAARGIDIQELPYVINYDLPQDIEDYIHRIGRTGRAGHSGEAISLICVEEKKQLREFERELKLTISHEILEGFEPTEKERRDYRPKAFKNKDKQRNKEANKKRSPGKPKASKKTTKRDANRSFSKK
mgnify:CR=1 FL=1